MAQRPTRHQPGRHEPTRHTPGGDDGGGAGPAVPKEQTVTYQSIDWKTLTTVFNAGQQQVPSYVFSNGRKFIQPADREI